MEQELELLDSPGIIPARQDDQNQALKLAICNDIGQASYDAQVTMNIEAQKNTTWYHSGPEYKLILTKKRFICSAVLMSSLNGFLH